MAKRNEADRAAGSSAESAASREEAKPKRRTAAPKVGADAEARPKPPARTPAKKTVKPEAAEASTPTPKPDVKKSAAPRKTAAKKNEPRAAGEKPVPAPKPATRPRATKKSEPETKPKTTRRTTRARTAAAANESPAPALDAQSALAPSQREAAQPAAASEIPAVLVRPAFAPAAAPPPSGGSRVVLMIRDPEWLYAYWDISPADREAHAIGQPQGAPPLMLRVFDFGTAPAPASTGSFFDVTVIPDASGWYLHVPSGGGNWSVALGYLDYEGSFVALAQSNVVSTPAPIQAWNEQVWGPAGEEIEMLEASGAAEGDFVETVGPDGQTRLVSRASRLMEYLRRLGAGQQGLRPGASEMGLRPGASEQVPRFGASEQVPRIGASEQVVPRIGASEQVLRPGASEAFLRPGASEQVLRPGASEQFAMPQPGGGAAVMAKSFWLQVHTELIVYGATEPDAKVTVQGIPITLRPDGTFTLRFALPDGEQVIPVHAVNADGDMERTITPIVKKRTV